MKTHLAYIYRKICFKLTIILASFGFKKTQNKYTTLSFPDFLRKLRHKPADVNLFIKVYCSF